MIRMRIDQATAGLALAVIAPLSAAAPTRSVPPVPVRDTVGRQ
ncbi:hypothetical protein ACGFX2_33070 [Streptomyces goshikiensis]